MDTAEPVTLDTPGFTASRVALIAIGLSQFDNVMIQGKPGEKWVEGLGKTPVASPRPSIPPVEGPAATPVSPSKPSPPAAAGSGVSPVSPPKPSPPAEDEMTRKRKIMM
jgi:cell division septation protein DedD